MQLSEDNHTWRSREVEDGATSAVETGLDGDGFTGLDGARFKKSVRVLLSENARLRAVLGHCPKGIAVLDEFGNVTGFNREFVNLVGRAPRLGESIADFFSPTDRDLLRSVVQRAGTTRNAAAVVRIETDSVSPREIEFLAATLPSGTDRSIGVVVAGDDRTAAFEDESVRATVDDANQRDTYALAIAAIRDDVDGMRLAAMNALRAVKGASDEDRARLREALEALEAQGALIGGERSDRWSTRPDGTCDVGEVARSAVRLVWVGRARRRVTMDAQIDEAISARIARSDLVQVISNVLRHAVEAMDGTSKFGWITIGAERCEDRVEIAVRDNGPGIPPSLLKRCFEPGEISRSAEDGQALGLAIARAIIEARGGSVRALSEPDRGTTIVISLPSA